MIVHSVFCFTLLFVCVLHSLYVCLEGPSALLHTPPRPRVFTPRERKTFYETLFVGTLVYSPPPCLWGFVVKPIGAPRLWRTAARRDELVKTMCLPNSPSHVAAQAGLGPQRASRPTPPRVLLRRGVAYRPAPLRIMSAGGHLHGMAAHAATSRVRAPALLWHPAGRARGPCRVEVHAQRAQPCAPCACAICVVPCAICRCALCPVSTGAPSACAACC